MVEERLHLRVPETQEEENETRLQAVAGLRAPLLHRDDPEELVRAAGGQKVERVLAKRDGDGGGLKGCLPRPMILQLDTFSPPLCFISSHCIIEWVLTGDCSYIYNYRSSVLDAN